MRGTPVRAQRTLEATPTAARFVATALATFLTAVVPTAYAAAAEPPTSTSTVGGELLGRPGTQVRPGGGAPRLPRGLSAKAWIVADAETGTVLAAHNAHRPLAPASTIKMLFAATVLPKFDRDDLYRARPEHFAEMGPGSSAVGLSDYRTYTVEDLWRGIFLASGNDAVYALTAMNGGKEQTVAEMNALAKELRALDTHVVNPDGYDAPGQVSSAYDLTLFARAGLQNRDFREYAATRSTDFPGSGKGKKRQTFEVQNTNRLLVGAPGLEPYEGLAGVKNGYTSKAGHTFTGVAERDGRALLVTCMGPDGDGLEVYRESAALLDWGFAAAGKVRPVGKLVPPGGEDEAGRGAWARASTAGGQGGADARSAADAELAGAARAEADGSAERSAVLAVTAAGLAVLAVGAYVFHRRHPLPPR